MIINPVSCRVEHTPELREAFEKVFSYLPAKFRPKTIIETGTADGTGTTALLCDVVWNSPMRRSGDFIKFSFISLEVDEERAKSARKTLSKYKPFLRIKTGLSVDVDEALEFLKNDELVNSPDDYPDLYYDSHTPYEFYRDEITNLPIQNDGLVRDNMLLRIIPDHRSKTPLFVLDSAGGIGWLEYQIVTKLMLNRPYWIWLHDIHHIKHVRSYCHIRNAEDCVIVAEKEKEWVLARFNFRSGRRRIQ